MIISVADQRRDGATDQPDAMRMSPRRELPIGTCYRCNHRAMGRGIHGSVAGHCAEIVDAFQHDCRTHVGPADHVPIEACEQIGAGAVEQHPIAADPGVDHRQARGGAARGQAAREFVGPPRVRIVTHAAAIGNRIADRDDHPRRAATADLDIGKAPPAADRQRVGQRRRSGLVAAHGKGRRAGAGMAGARRGRVGKIQADRQVVTRLGRKRQRIRIGFSTRGDGDRTCAGESQRRITGDNDTGGRTLAQRGGVDPERRSAGAVRQPHAHHRATARKVDDLPHRHRPQRCQLVGFGLGGDHLCRSPGRHPVWPLRPARGRHPGEQQRAARHHRRPPHPAPPCRPHPPDPLNPMPSAALPNTPRPRPVARSS